MLIILIVSIAAALLYMDRVIDQVSEDVATSDQVRRACLCFNHYRSLSADRGLYYSLYGNHWSFGCDDLRKSTMLEW